MFHLKNILLLILIKILSAEEISSKCNYSKDLFDSKNNYLKSMCWFVTPSDYTSAESSCINANMSLFAITTEEENSAFLTICNEKLGHDNDIEVWINGRQTDDGNWWVNETEKKPLLKSVWPTQIYSENENFLKYKNIDQDFTTKATNGTVTLTFICEFINTAFSPSSTTISNSDTSTSTTPKIDSTTSTTISSSTMTTSSSKNESTTTSLSSTSTKMSTTVSSTTSTAECPKCLLGLSGFVGMIANCAVALTSTTKEGTCSSGTMVTCSGIANTGISVTPNSKRCCCMPK
ncbi:hypothetical protein PVAND_016103 [Polypedilum vanderplanki]|uniref:C-type lectin domain-containing protein n=1 Tax=Polypedilum vanderplanki TaxID=319348 RepID=A0A9J6BEV9_POLVA|nr:hypothetical protein PVAND_016103 [Polypedilum vanderplanki]